MELNIKIICLFQFFKIYLYLKHALEYFFGNFKFYWQLLIFIFHYLSFMVPNIIHYYYRITNNYFLFHLRSSFNLD